MERLGSAELTRRAKSDVSPQRIHCVLSRRRFFVCVGVNVVCDGLCGVDRVPGLRGDDVERGRKRYAQNRNESRMLGRKR